MGDDMKFLLMFVSGLGTFILVLSSLVYILTEVGFWYGMGALFILTLIPLVILGLDHYVKVKVRQREEELEKIRKRYE